MLSSTSSKRLLPLPVVPQMTRRSSAGGAARADHRPKGLVAAVELDHGPADFRHHQRQRAAAVAAAPAIHQRFPLARLVQEQGFNVPGDIARHQRGAGLARLEGAHLFVHGADDDAFGVVEHRAVDGAGDMVEREFGFAAGVDDDVEFAQCGQDIVETLDGGIFHRARVFIGI
jgi:hypothetical protein